MRVFFKNYFILPKTLLELHPFHIYLFCQHEPAAYELVIPKNEFQYFFKMKLICVSCEKCMSQKRKSVLYWRNVIKLSKFMKIIEF